MLRRPQVEPFVVERAGCVQVRFLRDQGGRVLAFLERLLRLAVRLEGRPAGVVAEALRRQERRVRDASRLRGIAKTLLDLSDVRPPPGADLASRVREAVFRARGALWPPTPGDRLAPYERAAAELGLLVPDLDRLLYADTPAARLVVGVPRLAPQALLDRYNLELARGLLLDARQVTLTARGGWRRIFRAVKLARLMYEIAPRTRGGYRVTLTGPAAPFVVRAERYGARLARVVPALVRAPGWRLEAEVLRGGRSLIYRLDGRAPLGPMRRSGGRRRERPATTYDSSWERDLAREFRTKLGAERDGWTLAREATPVAAGGELLLPDFTLRHRDGREALVELVGFWTPEYLEAKLRKVRTAGLSHLILVVYRGLAVGREAEALEAAAPGPVVWFTDRPRAGEVLAAAERVARAADPSAHR